jgi:hypothetical protein
MPNYLMLQRFWLLEPQLRSKRSSEFSHGPGLVPPVFADNDPAHGGRYRPIAPPVEPKIGVARGSAGKPGGPWLA